MGDLFPAFRETERGQDVLTAALFQVTVVQNNMPKWHILGWPALNRISCLKV